MKIVEFLPPNPPIGKFDRIEVRHLDHGWQLKIVSKNNKIIVDAGTLYDTEQSFARPFFGFNAGA